MGVSVNQAFLRGCVFLLALYPVIASAWWNEEWPYRRAITLDSTQTGVEIKSSVAEVPVLIRLHSGNFEDFFLIKEDLSDLRFMAMDDKTPLKHHVEHFDLINQMLFIWVKVPVINGNLSTEKLWFYYGNSEAISSADVKGSFDANEAVAFHFQADESTVIDKTAYANVVLENTSNLNAASLIASGGRFDGKQRILLQDNPSTRMMPENGFTFSSWIKPEGTQLDNYLMHRKSGATEAIVAIDGNILYAKYVNGGSVFETPRSITLSDGAWQHIAVVFKAEELEVYLNGSAVMTVPISLVESAGDIYIGANKAGNQGFVGEMDEVRISKTARSADWIKL